MASMDSFFLHHNPTVGRFIKEKKKTKNKPILHARVGGIAAAFVILGFTSTNCIH